MPRRKSTKGALDIATVRAVAASARLPLSPAEERAMLSDLSSIIEAFSAVRSAKGKPAFHPFPIENVTRADIQSPCLSHGQALSNAQHTEAGFFKGPKVM